MPNLEEAIRERAYHLWIADGQPEGNADVYWLSAQREIRTTSLEGASETPATRHMDSVSTTTKPVKKVKVARSSKSRAAAIRIVHGIVDDADAPLIETRKKRRRFSSFADQE